MSQASLLSKLRNLIPISLGTAIFAFGLHFFVIPNKLMEGGVTGIAILLNYIFDLRPSLTSLLLNIPLFFVGWKYLGRNAMFYTIYGTISLSFFLWIMEILIAHDLITPFNAEHDYILAALYAGVTIGIGLGIVFRFGGTTGGVDILARIYSKKGGRSVGQFIFSTDVIIIGSSLFFITLDKVLYTLVTVFIASRVIDYIIEGAYEAKAFTIVSSNPDAIAEQITSQMERGVTLFHAQGAYSKEDKRVVYCVVSRSEIRQLNQIVRAIDPRAFIVISNVHDVLGEGFKDE
ncbi:YitT family protein [Paenibacillus sp. N1-5-1-14]|uniref:YitT family protein n=1 Tax=Paenibacillus radicibacter TaxID=2972488 RepID=UPI0021596C75|nr:YitT family protein [Paenibacillus radicibacter]MCR8642259.1 YitT family protein [Paenibacillus radicibacter]